MCNKIFIFISFYISLHIAISNNYVKEINLNVYEHHFSQMMQCVQRDEEKKELKTSIDLKKLEEHDEHGRDDDESYGLCVALFYFVS